MCENIVKSTGRLCGVNFGKENFRRTLILSKILSLSIDSQALLYVFLFPVILSSPQEVLRIQCGRGNIGNWYTYQRFIEQQLSDRHCVDLESHRIKGVIPAPGNEGRAWWRKEGTVHIYQEMTLTFAGRYVLAVVCIFSYYFDFTKLYYFLSWVYGEGISEFCVLWRIILEKFGLVSV